MEWSLRWNENFQKNVNVRVFELAKLDPTKYLGRKPGSNEGPIKFLSKPQNKKALDLLRKGYKNIEVAKITGLHVNTITKVKRHL